GFYHSHGRFEIEVEEVLAGDAGERLSAVWHNSTFQLPERMDEGPFLIALVPPMEPAGRSADQNPVWSKPGTMDVLQQDCTAPFILEPQSSTGFEVRARVWWREWGKLASTGLLAVALLIWWRRRRQRTGD